jgi:hypothetical protein
MQSAYLYPTSGASDDYSFSRHIADPTKNKVYAYTIEFGFGNNAASCPFYPTDAQYTSNLQETNAGFSKYLIAMKYFPQHPLLNQALASIVLFCCIHLLNSSLTRCLQWISCSQRLTLVLSKWLISPPNISRKYQILSITWCASIRFNICTKV